FTKLKRRFIKALILKIFNSKLPIILETNTLDYVYKYLINYISKKFSGAELNYDIYNKKLLTVVLVFKK
ncbi:hypothetical protein K469DRAFT_568509, partial [Zopfia rhizophila CBS 207.26]